MSVGKKLLELLFKRKRKNNMATKVRNGCVPAKLDLVVGATVQVMPRGAAMIVSRKHGESDPCYSPGADVALKTRGYLGYVKSVSKDVLVIAPIGSTLRYPISKSCIFGIAHNAMDVVEVGSTANPDHPPMRRLFVAYSFDSEFSPVVVTLNENNTVSVLDDRNSACIDLVFSEIWSYCYPARSECVPVEQIEVSVTVNGKPVNPGSLSKESWDALRG